MLMKVREDRCNNIKRTSRNIYWIRIIQLNEKIKLMNT